MSRVHQPGTGMIGHCPQSVANPKTRKPRSNLSTITLYINTPGLVFWRSALAPRTSVLQQKYIDADQDRSMTL
jgi:hypothetical protein